MSAFATHHESLRSDALGESGLDDGVHEDDFGELDRQVVLVPVRPRKEFRKCQPLGTSTRPSSQATEKSRSYARCGFLLHTGPDTNGRDRDVLPDELFGPARGRVKSEQFAVGVGDLAEQGQRLERVQVLDRLVDVHLELLVLMQRLVETVAPRLKVALALDAVPPARVLFRVPPSPLFVSDPHRTEFLDDAVDGAAVRAGGAFPAQGRELFREGGDGERVEVRSPEQGEEFPVLRRVEQDPRAGLRGRANRVSTAVVGRPFPPTEKTHTLQMHWRMLRACLK